jgi:hypothetical protein
MSIAHANIVSPLGSQHAPYRRCDPARGQQAMARTPDHPFEDLGLNNTA